MKDMDWEKVFAMSNACRQKIIQWAKPFWISNIYSWGQILHIFKVLEELLF